jgi:hypothetical protein
MQLRFNAFTVAVVAGTLALAACGERNPVGPDPDPSSAATLSFTHAGERAGSFAVQGAVPLSATGQASFGTWASALRVTGYPLNVVGVRAGTAPMTDVFTLVLQNITQPGTYPLDPGCNQHTTTPCVLGLFAFGVNWTNNTQAPSAEYRLATGSVTVTALTASQVRGTFQGSGVTFPAGTPALTITTGSFDVPIVTAGAVHRSVSAVWNAPPVLRFE